MASFKIFRLMTLASAMMLLGACSAVRLEDVPSTNAIDMAASKTRASLLIPPGMQEAPSNQPVVVEASQIGDSPVMEIPSRLDAVWSVRYRDNGFDAENAAGDTCSGWMASGEAGPRAGQSVKMACSNGRLASLLIATGDGRISPGTVFFGKTSETAYIENK